MARVNAAKRSVIIKLVYYGPGLSGKTTNLRQLHGGLLPERRGRLIQLDTETERTLFFDYFPHALGSAGYNVVVEVCSVPGQSFYNATRFALLEKVDGLVFVADSSPQREEANLTCLANLKRNLSPAGSRRWLWHGCPNRTPRRACAATR